MLKVADLAGRPDFDAGPLSVSAARREISGPAGIAHVEPIVMKVFLLLLDARGSVVTRDELFGNAWGGVFVGDDSLNRAIARVRKIAAETAPGLFEIGTIPRTGYRLTGAILNSPVEERKAGPPPAALASSMPRRALIGGGVAAAALVGAGAYWAVDRQRHDPRFDALMGRGRDAIRLDEPGGSTYFQQAAAIEPGNAEPWGLLAYSLANGVYTLSGTSGATAQAAEQAARKALAIDPNESNALLAITMIQSDLLDYIAREQRYRRILALDPRNALVMRHLGQMMHGVGRCRESLAIVERALQLEPLTPDHWVRKAMRLWVLGKVGDADRVIDRAMQYWPTHQLVRLARLMIYAFTGRARAALTIVESEEANPTFFGPAAGPAWHVSLAALDKPTAATVAAARKANIDGSQGSPQIAAWAILVLSALGELDGAFEVANGFLLDRGSVIVRPRKGNDSRVSNPGWRNTFGLFTPPTKAMRLDPRFKDLSDGLGLTEYWRRSGIGPDAFLMRP